MKFTLSCLQHLLRGMCCGAMGLFVVDTLKIAYNSDLGVIVFIAVSIFCLIVTHPKSMKE
jgi:hypothetical protein